MYILSQDKTRIYNMSGHIEGIGYEESKDYKQRKTEISDIRFRCLTDVQRRSRSSKRKKIVCW